MCSPLPTGLGLAALAKISSTLAYRNLQAAKGRGNRHIDNGPVVGLALPLKGTGAVLFSTLRSDTISGSHPNMIPCYVFGSLLPIFAISTPRSLAIAMRTS